MALKWKICCALTVILVSLTYAWVRREQASMFPDKYKAEQKQVMKMMDPSRAWQH
ncbi:MAG: hypothetical protein WAM39_02370 [Bryobacteraceae bacterium]